MINNVTIKPNEKIEPLGDGKYIIQSTDGYRFGADAVGLAHFVAEYAKQNSAVVDLCSGCGIIGIMLAVERGCKVVCIERDVGLWDMSVRSAAINGLSNVTAINADIRDSKALSRGAYDIVVCNPPFFKANAGRSKIAPEANCELTVTFSDVVNTAKSLLKVGGAFFVVHTATRLDEILTECRAHRLIPKELIINRNCKTFMLRAVHGAGSGMTVSIKE